MCAGKDDAAHWPAFHDDRRLGAGAHRVQRRKRLVDAARNHDLFLGAYDQIAGAQDRLQMRRNGVRFDVAFLACVVSRKAPKIWPIVDVEGNPAAVLLGEFYRQLLGRGSVGACEVGPGDDDRLGARDIIFVDVAFVERAVGAVFAIEDEREGAVVANAKNDDRAEALRVGAHTADVDALARALLSDEAAQVLVADAGDQPWLEPEPSRADRDIGWTASHRFREACHVLKSPADLRAVKVH